MQFEPWMEKATPNDMLNDDLKFVAETVGMRQALLLVFLLSGVYFYIPKNALRLVRDKHIINEYDGTKYTINRLAKECDLTTRQIYRIIEEHLNKSKNKDSKKV
ncbi:MAG: hypothetical protein IJ681_04975 [Bacteroidales bacterium]|nr:hypothetical protein [Bacteroidales bacterium]